MGTVNKGLVRVGIARQSAKGVVPASPEYVFGISGGAIGTAEPDEKELEQTWSEPGLADMDREGISTGADLDLMAMPLTIGAFLRCAVGQEAYTDAGGGKGKHTFTPKFPLSYAAVYGEYGGEGANTTVVQDAKIDTLEISWEKSGAAKVKVKYVGCDIEFGAEWDTSGAAYVVEHSSAGKLRGTGGTFTIDGTATRVTAGSVKIENGVEAFIDAASITPSEATEKAQRVSASLTNVPDDLSLYREIITGSPTGTTASGDVKYGALHIRLKCGANDYLDFAAPHMQFGTKLPDADPAGGPAELPLEARVVRPTDGAPAYTFELVNSRVTAY